MTPPAQRFRRWPNLSGGVLRLLLAGLLLVPVGVLSVQAWQGIDEKLTFAERERQGIEYLQSLERVTVALVDAQSAAVAGRSVPGEALTRAVENASSVDARLGDELRTRERWAGARAKIESLSQQNLRAPEEAYAAYSEAGDLLLALYGKVRETSGLIRDPDADSYHLQDSAAEELPEALIAAGRLGDIAMLATTRAEDQALNTAIQATGARSGVLEPVEDLVEGLQAAVNNTDSQQLSGNLLSQLDAYQIAVDALAAASAATDLGTPTRANQVGEARAAAQAAGADLSQTMLTELDNLVTVRADGLRTERLLAGAAAIAALLIALALIALSLAGRRSRPATAPVAPQARADAPDPPRAELPDRARGWELPAEWSDPVPAGQGLGRPAQSGLRDVGLLGRDNEPARWGRTDAR
ncbi:hypothetical protein O7627_30990 [Solwaraspora sp. WMMD1047]|uniref:hypothetical protein n=1 Tax=Solwaraspora sp. WMMD1047 TaxID=3016102 RepID=UPI00241778F5|nr:hypothetical protein [Solwaraspora sp. WMMD1047]MDG4833705.1 hypothetical protein [Solwaraspora sp. WMMD1047]